MKNILKQAAMSILLVALVCSFCITPAMAATEFIGETKENSAVVSDESAELAASSGWVKKSSGRFEYYSKAGKVTKKLVKKNGFFRYYLKKNGKWKAQKKVWVTISHNQYYVTSIMRMQKARSPRSTMVPAKRQSGIPVVNGSM